MPYKCNTISIIIIFLDQYCHHRSDNYILLLINVGPRNRKGCFQYPPHTSAFQKKNSAIRENHYIDFLLNCSSDYCLMNLDIISGRGT